MGRVSYIACPFSVVWRKKNKGVSPSRISNQYKGGCLVVSQGQSQISRVTRVKKKGLGMYSDLSRVFSQKKLACFPTGMSMLGKLVNCKAGCVVLDMSTGSKERE